MATLFPADSVGTRQYIQDAIDIGKSTYFDDPSPGKVVAWRTANSAATGKQFQLYRSVLGSELHYIP